MFFVTLELSLSRNGMRKDRALSALQVVVLHLEVLHATLCVHLH